MVVDPIAFPTRGLRVSRLRRWCLASVAAGGAALAWTPGAAAQQAPTPAARGNADASRTAVNSADSTTADRRARATAVRARAAELRRLSRLERQQDERDDRLQRDQVYQSAAPQGAAASAAAWSTANARQHAPRRMQTRLGDTPRPELRLRAVADSLDAQAARLSRAP